MSKTRNTKSLPKNKVSQVARSPQGKVDQSASFQSASSCPSSCSLPLRGLRAKVDPRRRLRLLLVLPFAPFGKKRHFVPFFLIWVVLLWLLCLLVVVVLLLLLLFCLCQKGASPPTGTYPQNVGKKNHLFFLPLLYCGLLLAGGQPTTPRLSALLLEARFSFLAVAVLAGGSGREEFVKSLPPPAGF